MTMGGLESTDDDEEDAASAQEEIFQSLDLEFSEDGRFLHVISAREFIK